MSSTNVVHNCRGRDLPSLEEGRSSAADIGRLGGRIVVEARACSTRSVLVFRCSLGKSETRFGDDVGGRGGGLQDVGVEEAMSKKRMVR